MNPSRMRPRWAAALVLGWAGTLGAQTASLTIDDNGQRVPLKIDRARAEVVFVGGVAETTLTLRFVNHTKRMLEGEFVMPLPAGATVSSYALEVNGSLRESVAVEKEKARNAYETIKRQMIDPGLVEREAGNIYRTRVFPVPANGTKEMRIGFVEDLRLGEDGLHYRLPLRFPHPIDDFSCSVARRGAGSLEIDPPEGLKLAAAGNRHTGSAKKIRLDGELAVVWKRDTGAIDVVAEDDGYNRIWFQASGFFPRDLQPEPRPAPEFVHLVWDASDSARSLDRKKIHALLKAYFENLPDVAVRLHLLRTKSEDAGVFESWEALQKRLEGIFYDGATDFGKLPTIRGEGNTVILVTDCRASFSDSSPDVGNHPFFLVNGGASETSAPMLAAASGESNALVELGRESVESALHKMTHLPPRIALKNLNLRDTRLAFDGKPGSPFRLSGWLSRFRGGNYEVSFTHGGDGHGVPFAAPQVSKLPPQRSIARRLWAQQHLAYIEAKPHRYADEALRFAVKHNLVSDHTSLIVLERMSDHVRYRIPPPEPDLRRKYDEHLAAERAKSGGHSGFSLAWQKRLSWYQTEFPWADVALWGPMQRVGIWRAAMERTFGEETLNHEENWFILNWHACALALIERRGQIRNQKDLDLWMREISGLVEDSGTFWKVDTKLPPSKGPTEVSVRGLVKQPGTVASEGPLTLREALRGAGGPSLLGSYTNVGLYRRAGRVFFNMLSNEYGKVHLQPGDMVVVGRRYEEYYGSDGFAVDDPFAAGEPTPPPSPRDMPAVVEDGPPTFSFNGEEPFADSGGSGMKRTLGGPQTKIPSLPVRMIATTEAAPADSGKVPASIEKLKTALKNGAEPGRAYAEAKGGNRRTDRFHIEAARALFAGKHTELGHRALSNLVEHRSDAQALRAYAMWLAEFVSPMAAHYVLRKHTSLEVSSSPAQLDAARYAVRGKVPDTAAREYVRFIEKTGSEERHGLGVIARTELNAILHDTEVADDPFFISETKNLECDVRVVLTSDTGDVHLAIVDPLGDEVDLGTRASPCGGKITASAPHHEYMMRRGLPGNYKIVCDNGRSFSRNATATVQVGMFTNWGRDNEVATWLTVYLDEREKTVGTLRFALGDPE